jgi:hypothetical protein
MIGLPEGSVPVNNSVIVACILDSVALSNRVLKELFTV